MKKENNKLLIKCDEIIDENIFNIFCDKILNEFYEIDTWFNIEHEKLILNVVSKENLDIIVKNISEQYKNIEVPKWLVGFSNSEEVWVTIPNDETIEELYKVALHELTHLISYRLDMTNKRLKLLDEGLAVYLAKQYEDKIYSIWIDAYLNNKLPQLKDFCTYDGIEYSKKKGYIFSYLIIDFLIKKYGKETFLSWLQNPQKFMERIDEINESYNKYIIEKIEARI